MDNVLYVYIYDSSPLHQLTTACIYVVIVPTDKNKKENMSVHFLKSMMTPEDINTWFHDGNPVVKQYLTPRALSCLRLDNSVRKMCVDLMLKLWFDRVILISICLNAIFLAADNPLNTKNQKVCVT